MTANSAEKRRVRELAKRDGLGYQQALQFNRDIRQIEDRAVDHAGRLPFSATGLSEKRLGEMIRRGYLIEEPPGYVCIGERGEIAL